MVQDIDLSDRLGYQIHEAELITEVRSIKRVHVAGNN